MHLVIEWPQIYVFVCTAITLCAEGHFHGQEKKTKRNIGSAIVRAILSSVILYYGGFFRFTP